MLLMSIGQHILAYKYFILIPAALFGGPIISLFSGSLIKTGYLLPLPTYLCLMAGELIGDIAWYWIGYSVGKPFAKRFGKYVGITDRHITVVTRLFQDFPERILFFSKITMGLGFAIVTLFTAGLAHIPFRRYLLVNFCGQMIWSAVLLLLGYALGYLFLLQGNMVRIVLLILYTLIFLTILIFEKSLRRWLLRRYREDIAAS